MSQRKYTKAIPFQWKTILLLCDSYNVRKTGESKVAIWWQNRGRARARAADGGPDKQLQDNST